VRPLRILYHHRIRADDGQAVHVRELIAALRRRGHEVLECALVPKTLLPKTGAPAPTVHGVGHVANGTANGAGAFWQRLRLPRTAVEVLEVLYNRRGRARLRAAGASFRPDFVYERHALHCRAGLDAARALGVPLLLEVNSPMVDEMQQLGALRFPALARRTERAVLGGADCVFAVSEVLRGILVERGARSDRVRVVPNAAEPERYGEPARQAGALLRTRLGLPAGAFVLGFVGYLRAWHRLELLLDAMGTPGLEPVHLLLIGRGPALPALREGAAARGLVARVHAVGEVPQDLLPAHVCACDATLVPAINPYASPLKLFDSLAAGVPVLAPDQPNLRELLVDGQSGLLFAPGDAGALAGKLRALALDRAAAARLGAAGRARLLERRWTWDGNADRVADAFAALGAQVSA
jgi:glycosyltransferase involved in cell wall biosynthesis